MSPSPPKHRKLITQACDKSMRPSTSGWSKLTSRKYVCCQMLQVSLSFPPLPLSGTSCNVQYRCTIYRCQYSGSPQRETWSKSNSHFDKRRLVGLFHIMLLNNEHISEIYFYRPSLGRHTFYKSRLTCYYM